MLEEITIHKSNNGRWGTIRRPNIRFYYRIDRKPVGRVLIWTDFDMSHVMGPKDALYLQDLAVHPKYRKKGIAKQLIQNIINMFDKDIYLRAEENNAYGEVGMNIDKLKSFYHSYGFKNVGAKPRYNNGFGDYDGLIVGTGKNAMVRTSII